MFVGPHRRIIQDSHPIVHADTVQSSGRSVWASVCLQWVESGHEIGGEIIPALALFAVSRPCYEAIITGQTVGSGG
jgi:hypothetical protein